MAKISTYPLDSSPNIGDKLIGTDVNDSNATKNLTVGQILSVPGSATYVPYTGATGNVNLGANDLTATDITATNFFGTDITITGDVYTDSIKAIGTSLTTYDNGGQAFGMFINYSANRVRLGDFNGAYLGTEFDVDDVNQWITIGGSLRVNGSVGNAGDVLVSQGSLLPPQWVAESTLYPTIDQVLATGNTATDKDLVINTTGVGNITLDGTTLPRLFTATVIGGTSFDTTIIAGGATFRNVTLNKRADYNIGGIDYLQAGNTLSIEAPTSFSTNTITYPDTSGTFAVSVNGVASDSAGNVELYKEYSALISISGPGNVTATVLRNTLGATVAWTNPSNGLVIATASSSVFTGAKTWLSSGSYNNGGVPYFITSEWDLVNPGDRILYNIFLHDGTQTSTPNLVEYSVEIRVYP